jgi:hypothetical protein
VAGGDDAGTGHWAGSWFVAAVGMRQALVTEKRRHLSQVSDEIATL